MLGYNPLCLGERQRERERERRGRWGGGGKEGVTETQAKSKGSHYPHTIFESAVFFNRTASRPRVIFFFAVL